MITYFKHSFGNRRCNLTNYRFNSVNGNKIFISLKKTKNNSESTLNVFEKKKDKERMKTCCLPLILICIPIQNG